MNRESVAQHIARQDRRQAGLGAGILDHTLDAANAHGLSAIGQKQSRDIVCAAVEILSNDGSSGGAEGCLLDAAALELFHDVTTGKAEVGAVQGGDRARTHAGAGDEADHCEIPQRHLLSGCPEKLSQLGLGQVRGKLTARRHLGVAKWFGRVVGNKLSQGQEGAELPETPDNSLDQVGAPIGPSVLDVPAQEVRSEVLQGCRLGVAVLAELTQVACQFLEGGR